jgi:hypothetical protein
MKSQTLCEELEAFWDEQLPSIPRPPRAQFEKWIHIHGYSGEPLRHAIRAAVRRLMRRPFNDERHHIQFLSAVALDFLKETAAGMDRAA